MSQASVSEGGRTHRRGLVLEGGGAKGSWQFGVLLALAEKGIEFDAVSGTSVGALNGALWCAGKLQAGREMWQSMSLGRVFATKIWLAPSFVIGLFCRTFYALLYDFVPEEPEDPQRSLVQVGKILMMLPGLSTATLLFIEMVKVASILGILSSLVLAYVFVLGRLSEPHRGRHFFLDIGITLWCVGAATWMLLGGAWDDWPVVAVGALPIGLLGIAWALRQANLSLFVPRPLETTIRSILTEPLKTPLFATVARNVDAYYDPNSVDYMRIVPDHEPPYWSPLSRSALLPVYQRVDCATLDEAVEALLASSALPLGLVSARRDEKGRRIFDGGTVDNLPWHPLVGDIFCEELVIVRCNPGAMWDDLKERKKWTDRDRLQRVVELGFVAWEIKSGSPRIEVSVAARRPPYWPQVVTVIAPAASLGGMLSGTLDFSKEGCRKRLEDGYRAGLNAAATTSNGPR